MAVIKRPWKRNDMLNILTEGKWILTLRKKDGTARFIHATRDTSIIPEEKMGVHRLRDNTPDTLSVYDLEQGKFRDFKYDSLYGYERLLG